MIQWIAQNKDFAEAMSYWATVAGFFVAIVGGIIVIWTHRSNAHQENWNRAHELYGQYLADSLNHPEYFRAYWSRNDISDDDRWKYHCFVSQILWALEGILENTKTNQKANEWRAAAINDLTYHTDFLASEQFREEFDIYMPSLRAVIREAISSRAGGPAHA